MNQYRTPELPIVVKNLIILNVLCFIGINLFQPQLQNYLAMHLWGARDFAPYQYITHLFMHGSMGHIFFNMFALWMFGSFLEQRWGSKRFLTYYIFTGLGAAVLYSIAAYWELYPSILPLQQFLDQPSPETLTQLLHNTDFGALAYCDILPDQNICPTYNNFQQNAALFIQNKEQALLSPLMSYVYDYKAYYLNMRRAVGASGAIYGLIMAYAFVVPNQVLYFYGIIPIKAKYFALIIGIVALVMGMRNNPGDNIAHFAHLGGMVFGYILLKYWQKNKQLN